MNWIKKWLTPAPKASPKLSLPPDFNLDISGAWPIVERFPRPDWKLISDHIRKQLPREQWFEAYTTAAKLWLDKFAQAFGSNYHVDSAPRVLLLSSLPRQSGRELLEICAEVESATLSAFDLRLDKQGYGPRVVIVFPDEQSYYDYEALMYPEEREFVGSPAALIRKGGYMHIVLVLAPFPELIRSTAQMMTRVCLASPRFPVWLLEGMVHVMNREHKYDTPSNPTINEHLYQEHHHFWNRERIQQFWTGELFSRSEHASRLSHSLAEVLVNILLGEFGKTAFSKFVHSANWDDAGESAAVECFGRGLSEIVSVFLGPEFVLSSEAVDAGAPAALDATPPAAHGQS